MLDLSSVLASKNYKEVKMKIEKTHDQLPRDQQLLTVNKIIIVGMSLGNCWSFIHIMDRREVHRSPEKVNKDISLGLF